MKTELKCDTHGRLYLNESVRETYGTRFIGIFMPDRIILRPLVDDPIKDFHELGKTLPKNITIGDMKKAIMRRAMKEAAENAARINRAAKKR
ncbi:MAG: hypothetical protein J4473_01210 [Candidatus Aenigmarchaeota archaeon]|nr:hypothetical protein [Candidatus Aenigmarchaeota archaeon]